VKLVNLRKLGDLLSLLQQADNRTVIYFLVKICVYISLYINI
jgi:hypothetical protein